MTGFTLLTAARKLALSTALLTLPFSAEAMIEAKGPPVSLVPVTLPHHSLIQPMSQAEADAQQSQYRPYANAQQQHGLCDWDSMGRAVVDALAAGGPLEGYYLACQSAIRSHLQQVGVILNEDETRAIFAMNAAYSSRPYGPSTALTIRDLHAARVLDCDNYNMLAWYIYEALGGEREFWFLGWNGGALGNHAQIYYEGEERDMMLDPTAAIIGFAGLWEMLDDGAGDDVVGASFYWRDEWQTNWMPNFVPISHREGMPDCAQMYFVRASDYPTLPGSASWPTPGARLLEGAIRSCKS